jgi:hypothetical protein
VQWCLREDEGSKSFVLFRREYTVAARLEKYYHTTDSSVLTLQLALHSLNVMTVRMTHGKSSRVATSNLPFRIDT